MKFLFRTPGASSSGSQSQNSIEILQKGREEAHTYVQNRAGEFQLQQFSLGHGNQHANILASWPSSEHRGKMLVM